MRKALTLSTPLPFDARAQIERIRREIAWYESETNKTLRLALQYKLEIGRRLMHVKSLLPHGQFLNWAREEFGWTPKHIQNHLTLAANAKCVSHLPSGASLRLALATIKEAQSPNRVPKPLFQPAIPDRFFNRFQPTRILTRFVELAELRGMLEPEIAAKAAISRDEHLCATLREAIAEMDGQLNDPERFIDADLDFHLALAEAGGNSLVLGTIDSIAGLLRAQRTRIFQVNGGPEREQVYHRRILKAIEEGDPSMAHQAMRAHLNQVRLDLSGALGEVLLDRAHEEPLSYRDYHSSSTC
jgi:hypothetical protein